MSTFPPEETTQTDNQAPAKEKNPFVEMVQFALLALLIVLPIRLFIAQPFIVSGASMENTFHNSEYLIVDRVSYRFHQPQRGDVIIFRYPQDPSKYFIKRIIGLPGETIQIAGDAVIISNNQYPEGMTLNEPYIKSMEKISTLSDTLENNEYFVMGDNRDASSDSRVWGPLEEDKIIGRALVRLFPFSNVTALPGATTVSGERITSTN